MIVKELQKSLVYDKRQQVTDGLHRQVGLHECVLFAFALLPEDERAIAVEGEFWHSEQSLDFRLLKIDAPHLDDDGVRELQILDGLVRLRQAGGKNGGQDGQPQERRSALVETRHHIHHIE